MEQELITIKSNSPTLSAVDIRKQVNLIQEVMEAVMVGPTKENPSGVHYGVIPGCKLPSLYKAGAEKLAMTFRLGTDFEELPGSCESDTFICYKINCKLFYIPTGNVVGNGRGVCNSKEKKYRTRMVYANKATFEEKAIGREEERNGDKGTFKVYIVPQDPWDVQNTIYKMACKRAMVAAIINATGASDIFSQDVEDLPEGTVLDSEVHVNGKPSVSMPKEKESPSITYSDIISLAQGKIGDVMNVSAYGISVKHGVVGDKKTDITEYIVGDLPKDPTAQIKIKAWGKPIDAGVGALIKFNGVTIGEYKGTRQFTANEAVCG